MIDELKDEAIDMIIQYAVVGAVSIACIGTIKLLKSTKNKISNKIFNRRSVI